MEDIKNRLSEMCGQKGILLTEKQLAQFQRYMELLVEWNQKMNLTAITDPEGVTVKHFYDSLILLQAVEIPEGARLIDVGTGAGFPGIPLAIARPDIRLTLLDSLNKRLTFLAEVCRELEIQAELRHARAEEGGRQKELREQFDIATARAVAGMNVLSEYCLPYWAASRRSWKSLNFPIAAGGVLQSSERYGKPRRPIRGMAQKLQRSLCKAKK